MVIERPLCYSLAALLLWRARLLGREECGGCSDA